MMEYTNDETVTSKEKLSFQKETHEQNSKVLQDETLTMFVYL